MGNSLLKFAHMIDSVSEWSGRILSCSLLAVVFVLLYEVVFRYALNSPTIWAHELIQYFFGVYAVGLGAYSHLHNSHVRMDLLYNHFSARGKAMLDIITSPIVLYWMILVFVFGGKFALRSMSYWEHSTTAWSPAIWPVKLMIPISALLLMLQGISNLIRNIHVAMKGER